MNEHHRDSDNTREGEEGSMHACMHARTRKVHTGGFASMLGLLTVAPFLAGSSCEPQYPVPEDTRATIEGLNLLLATAAAENPDAV